MKRFILTLAAVALTAATSTAGPIRDRIAARFSRPACATCQPQQVQYAQPVAYQTHTPGPVQAFAGNVLTATGTVIQQAGGVVSSYQPAGFAPVFRGTTCSGGVCR